MKAPWLKSLRDLKLLARRRHLRKRQNERLFLGKMKDDSLPPELCVSLQKAQPMIERERKPALIRCDVQIEVGIDEYRKEGKQRSEEERIHKKFAHIRNMSEFAKNIKFYPILTISASSSPFKKSGIS